VCGRKHFGSVLVPTIANLHENLFCFYFFCQEGIHRKQSLVCYIMGSNGKPEILPYCLALVVIAHIKTAMHTILRVCGAIDVYKVIYNS